MHNTLQNSRGELGRTLCKWQRTWYLATTYHNSFSLYVLPYPILKPFRSWHLCVPTGRQLTTLLGSDLSFLLPLAQFHLTLYFWNLIVFPCYHLYSSSHVATHTHKASFPRRMKRLESCSSNSPIASTCLALSLPPSLFLYNTLYSHPQTTHQFASLCSCISSLCRKQTETKCGSGNIMVG